jgi:predicted Zn-dependent protease
MRRLLARSLGILLLAAVASAVAQVPSLLAVPGNLPSTQRGALVSQRAALEAQWDGLRSRVEAHNAQCTGVPANSAASAECRQRMAGLQNDVGAYVSAVKEFNAMIAGLAAAPPQGASGLISEGEEAEIGRLVTAELDSRMTLVTDPQVTRYVEGIFARVVAHAPRAGVAYRVRVCRDCVVDICWAACSMPGGSVYVSTRLIGMLDNESELAGVLAHEVGHISARHAAQSRDDLARTTITAVLTGGPAWPVVQKVLFYRNSREHELESDRLAVEMLYQAGIRPTSLTTTFEKLRRLPPPPPPPPSAPPPPGADLLRTMNDIYFSTHPSPRERIDAIAPLLADPRFNAIRTVDSPDFHRIQTRLP